MEKYFNIESLYLFTRVVEARSFAEVGQKLKIPKATLSRKIAQLEEELGVQLLMRTTRDVRPTEIGRVFFQKAIVLLGAAEDAKAVVTKTKKEPHGLLRISAGVEFGLCQISPIIDRYISLFPKVDVELDLTGRLVDLAYEGFDLGIRVGALDDSSLSSRKIGSFSYGLYASPKLFDKKNAPKKIDDLSKWPSLAFSRGHHKEKWVLIRGSESIELEVKPKVLSNNQWVLRDAAIAGHGIVFVPSFLVTDATANKTLIPLFPEWKSVEIPVHALFPSQRYVSSKVRSFIEFLVKELKLPK